MVQLRIFVGAAAFVENAANQFIKEKTEENDKAKAGHEVKTLMNFYPMHTQIAIDSYEGGTSTQLLLTYERGDYIK